MVALTFTIRNTSDKMLYVRTLEASIKAPSGDATAEAVSAVDFERYFQAFPALKVGAQPALPPEAKIQPGRNGRAHHHRRVPHNARRLQPAALPRAS